MAAATKSWTLSAEQRELLIRSCFEAKKFSYSPYSEFRVGAALLTLDGRVIKGACVDNASGGSICAERTALVKAVSEGVRSFIGLAVTTDVAAQISPCGLCRQFIREFCSIEMPIFLAPVDYYDTEKEDSEKIPIQVTNLGELLPFSLSPGDLELPRKPS